MTASHTERVEIARLSKLRRPVFRSGSFSKCALPSKLRLTLSIAGFQGDEHVFVIYSTSFRSNLTG